MRSIIRGILRGILIWMLLGSAAQAADPASLKPRLEAHLKSLLDGKRASMLKVEDYYPVVFVVSAGKIEAIERSENSDYEATLKFEVNTRIEQDSARKPPRSVRVADRHEATVKITFRPEANRILWVRPLTAPFVFEGRETRYLLAPPGSP